MSRRSSEGAKADSLRSPVASFLFAMVTRHPTALEVVMNKEDVMRQL